MRIMKRLIGAFLSESADLVTLLPDEINTKVNCMADFPNQVGVLPAPAVEGDFSDTNPRSFVNAGPGGLVAGPNGARVGRWCWWNALYLDSDNAPSAVSNINGAGPPTGILFRNQQGLITTYLQASGMTVPQGFPLALMKAGGIWVVNAGTNNAQVGNWVYASFADGSSIFGTGGTIGTSGLNALTATGSIGPGSTTAIGSITGNILTVTGTLGGSSFIPVGAALTGGTGIAAGTVIVSQISGATGSAGGAKYALNIPQQSVAQAGLTFTYGVLTITGSVTGGSLTVGDQLTATGTVLTVGTTITALGTGTGQSGTYYLNNTQTVSSETMTSQVNILTKWQAMSAGKPGELIKISSDLLG